MYRRTDAQTHRHTPSSIRPIVPACVLCSAFLPPGHAGHGSLRLRLPADRPDTGNSAYTYVYNPVGHVRTRSPSPHSADVPVVCLTSAHRFVACLSQCVIVVTALFLRVVQIFQDIELPSETAEFERVYSHVMKRRHHLVWQIVNNTDVINLDRLVG